MTEHDILLALSLIVAVVSLAVILMAAAVVNVKRQLREVREPMERNQNEQSELSAAVTDMIDRFDAQQLAIERLAEKLGEHDLDAPQHDRYGDAIAKVRAGADIDELVDEFGLTLDEASLLVRLHGPKQANQ